MRQSLAIATIFLLLLPAAVASAAETYTIEYKGASVVRTYPAGSHPVVGLALSGGGARGIAHVGILQVLEENGILVERIAGTSMGSIIGGLYAAGYSPLTIENMLRDMDFSDAFGSAPNRRSIYLDEKQNIEWPLFELRFDGFEARLPSSLSSGQRISTVLSWLTLGPTYECGGDFSRLPIPFRAVATDLRTGNRVVLGEGNLGRAMQASSTIPLLFTPVEWGDYLLVDGGLRTNLPISVAREMGADFVIAIAIDESMHPPEQLDNPLNIADQATSILMRNVSRLSRGDADFVINPDLEAYSSRSFGEVADMIAAGREATLQALPALADTLAAAGERYPHITVRTIAVHPEDRLERIRLLLEEHLQPGRPVPRSAIVTALERLFRSGRYRRIQADFDAAAESLTVTLDPAPDTVRIIMKVVDGSSEPHEFPTRMNGRPSIRQTKLAVDQYIHGIRAEGASLAYIADETFDPVENRLTCVVAVPRLAAIEIAPGVRSRRSFVLRECLSKLGEPLNLNAVMQSVDNLYGMNQYNSVWADIQPRLDGAALIFHLDEKNWTVARFGLRYDETFGTEGRLNLTRQNILGVGTQLGFTAHSGARNKLLMAESRANRIYKTFYTFDIKTYTQYRKRPVYRSHGESVDYEDDRFGTIISAGHQMDKLGNLLGMFKSETVRAGFSPAAGFRDERKELRSIVVRSLVDSFDRYPFPQNGSTQTMYIESATEVLGGSEQFVKVYWAGSVAATPLERHTFLGHLALGTADPSIPDIEAFTLGGVPSRLNCYDAETAAAHWYADFPGLADEERRGTRLAAGTLAYRLFVPRMFYLTLSYSIGNVWPRGSVITANTLLQGYGVTGSLATFIGPITLGWGITSQGDDRVSLSAGWEY